MAKNILSMSRRSALLLIVALGITAITEPVSAKDPKKNYDVSVFRNFKDLPANTTLQSKTVKTIRTQFPGWVATTDKLNGAFTDIYGAPISVAGTTNRDKTQAYFDQKLKQFGINKSEWTQVSAPSAPKADYVNYKQSIGGHAVVFSWLSFRFTKSGELSRIQMKNYGTPGRNSVPVITAKDAKAIAVKDLDGVTIISEPSIDADWKWFPVPSAKGYELHPAWRFKVSGRVQGGTPLELNGYIDATNGALLYRSNEVKETGYDLTVKGTVYKNGTLHPATLEPLGNLDLNIGSSVYNTDTAGLFSDASLVLPLSTDIPLAGKWSTVIDSGTGLTPLFTNLVTLPGTVYTYPTTTPASSRHINAYYHVNRVHDFMKSLLPAFTGMDSSLITNVDLVGGTCNAFYNGHSINFFAASTNCNSMAEIGDIVYHEYGHAISDHFYNWITAGGTIDNGALNEANSDVWGMGITHNPVLGENTFVSAVGFIRRYDVTPQVYPIDLQNFDSHKDGQIIAGCWWDLGVNIGNVDTMMRLFTDVYYDVPDGPDGTEGIVYQTILIDALMADDNNSNLSDGTPHFAQIVAAFAKHGIYLEGDVLISHAEPNRPYEGSPIPITAYLSTATMDFLHDLTFYYRINSAGAWTPVTMTLTGAMYSGDIPAQPLGTVVEYYFIAHDSLNNPNAFFPITCNPALPANQQSLPYQFAVGVKSVDSTDFESGVAGWNVGSNPGDNASGGLFHWGTPITNTFFPAWPVGDHTHGVGGNCLITGAGNIGFLGTGVQRGTTTAISPVFDISGYTTPIVEYYRWFSNEQDFSNFKNDPWVVKIRDASGTSWQTVENTYQSDNGWRRRVFPVSAFVPGTPSQIQMKFFASDSIINTLQDDGQSTTVGGVDDFFIYDKGVPAGVNSVAQVKANIFPNPADDRVVVSLSNSPKGSILIYDMAGQIVSTTAMSAGKSTYEVSTAALASGTYNLVILAEKSIQSKKIVVSHK